MIIGVDLGMKQSSYCGIDGDSLRLLRVNDWQNPAMLSGVRGWAQGAELVVIERIDAEDFRRATGLYATLKGLETRLRSAVADAGLALIVAGKTEIRGRVGGYHPKHCGAAKTYINHWLQGLRLLAGAYHPEFNPRERTEGTPVPLYRTGRGTPLCSDDRRDALFCALYGALLRRDQSQSGPSGPDAKAFHVKQAEECKVQSAKCKDEDRRIA
jgi:hypothetical protein